MPIAKQVNRTMTKESNTIMADAFISQVYTEEDEEVKLILSYLGYDNISLFIKPRKTMS